MLNYISKLLQLDSPLGFALATRIWQAGAGFVTAALLIGAMTLPELGVYYTIISIVGIQAYFEMGLLNVLVSFSGHEAAVMTAAASPDVTAGEQPAEWLQAAARMRDIIRCSFRWFGTAAIIFAVLAFGSGYYTLSESNVAWLGPLLVIIPVAAVSVALGPAIAILEGAGYRDLIYRFRFIQAVAGSLVVWSTLIGGFGLWAIVAASAVQAVMSAYLTFVTKSSFFLKFRNMTSVSSNFSWTRDLLPVQWRMALISTTFHFATQCFVIIVTMFHGDAASAPLGMTLSMTGAIQMLALAWVQSKYSVAAALHGAGDRESAGTIWRHTAIVSTGILVSAFAVLTIAVACLPLLGTTIQENFLPPWQVIMLGLGSLANHVTAVQGFYVLSRKAKPLLAASLAGSLSTAAAVWIGGYLYSTPGLVVGYAAAMTLIFAPIHSLAYMRSRGQNER